VPAGNPRGNATPTVSAAPVGCRAGPTCTGRSAIWPRRAPTGHDLASGGGSGLALTGSVGAGARGADGGGLVTVGGATAAGALMLAGKLHYYYEYARPDGSHYLINGSKVFATFSPDAQIFLIYVRFGPGLGGIGPVLLERDTLGVTSGAPAGRYSPTLAFFS